MKTYLHWLAVLCYIALISSCVSRSDGKEAAAADTAHGRVLRVPADHSTIQAAIDAAHDGDTVLVSPGIYRESLRIGGKSLRLVSEFDSTRDQSAVQKTILDGAAEADAGRTHRLDQVILVDPDAGPKTEIVGFTIRGGDDGISCGGEVRIAHNYFTDNDDAIDYEGGGGLCEFNRFERNHDDAVDYDGPCSATVLHNQIVDNDDDGIEIRLQPYRGPVLQLTIRDNVITGNREDGIQIIGYPELSDRRIRIERNVIVHNAMAGIGLMSDATTSEDYRGAAIPEPVEVINNTIADNEYGLTGGANLVAINNIITANRKLGIKNLVGQSVAAHNLLWANGENADAASNVRDENTLLADPQLDDQWRPTSNSPCLGAGVTQFAAPTGTVTTDGAKTSGATCDLGALPPAPSSRN